MSTVDLSALRAPRPHRADAARNYDALLVTAREMFNEHGASAPMEEIASRAGVSIATLYRNFPTQEELLENVYLTEVEAVCRLAAEISGEEPWNGITSWVRRFVEYVGTKKAVAVGMRPDSKIFKACADALSVAGAPLLERAQQAGVIRSDIDVDDLMRMAIAFNLVNFASREQRDRMLNVAFDGLRQAATP